MPCHPLSRRTDYYAIVCTRTRRPRMRRCVVCNQPETSTSLVLCDYRDTPQGRTCSAALCADHALHVEPNLDYCPTHARAREEQR